MALPHSLYEALGDSTRLEIVRRLGEGGPQPTVPLLAGLGMSRQAATKHLHILEQAGLVKSTPAGRQTLRALDIDRLASAGEWLAARAAEWDRKLEKLKRLVESPR